MSGLKPEVFPSTAMHPGLPIPVTRGEISKKSRNGDPGACMAVRVNTVSSDFHLLQSTHVSTGGRSYDLGAHRG